MRHLNQSLAASRLIVMIFSFQFACHDKSYTSVIVSVQSHVLSYLAELYFKVFQSCTSRWPHHRLHLWKIFSIWCILFFDLGYLFICARFVCWFKKVTEEIKRLPLHQCYGELRIMCVLHHFPVGRFTMLWWIWINMLSSLYSSLTNSTINDFSLSHKLKPVFTFISVFIQTNVITLAESESVSWWVSFMGLVLEIV